jgi:hypothetical protein
VTKFLEIEARVSEKIGTSRSKMNFSNTTNPDFNWVVWLNTTFGIAGFFAWTSVFLSSWLIYKHLRNYNEPNLQRPIVRIILMVPLYAINSWVSLKYVHISIYLDLVRDSYEAYVVYQFFVLLIEFIDTHDNPLSDLRHNERTQGEEEENIVTILRMIIF